MSEPVWSLPRRVAFRFGMIAAVLFLFPFPFGMIPKTEWIAELAMKPWDWAVPWFAETILGLEAPQRIPTGSGDTLYVWVQTLLLLVVAAIGAAVWSALDRKRTAYPRLQDWALVALRYYLCVTMLLYGIAKVFEGQFPAPVPARLDQSVGEMSPMGLLWTFMGHSRPYSIFGGLAEVIGGLLLLSRRTTPLGALIVGAVMTNVFMLNMSYDVPVKLYSFELLVMAGLILLPHARRLARAVLGYATCEVPPRPRSAPRIERARLAAKVAFLLCVGGGVLLSMRDTSGGRMPPKNELHGIWVVETFAADGIERAPLITDAARWRKLIVMQWGVQLRAMTDQRTWYRPARIDPQARTITLTVGEAHTEVVLRYQRIGEHRLVIDGVLDGKQLHVTLVKESAPLLATRGFHWVQELPFNR